jgi:hypothetical protein
VVYRQRIVTERFACQFASQLARERHGQGNAVSPDLRAEGPVGQDHAPADRGAGGKKLRIADSLQHDGYPVSGRADWMGRGRDGLPLTEASDSGRGADPAICSEERNPRLGAERGTDAHQRHAIDRQQALAAVAAVGARTADIIRAIGDLDGRTRSLDWTLGQRMRSTCACRRATDRGHPGWAELRRPRGLPRWAQRTGVPVPGGCAHRAVDAHLRRIRVHRHGAAVAPGYQWAEGRNPDRRTPHARAAWTWALYGCPSRSIWSVRPESA